MAFLNFQQDKMLWSRPTIYYYYIYGSKLVQLWLVIYYIYGYEIIKFMLGITFMVKIITYVVGIRFMIYYLWIIQSSLSWNKVFVTEPLFHRYCL